MYHWNGGVVIKDPEETNGNSPAERRAISNESRPAKDNTQNSSRAAVNATSINGTSKIGDALNNSEGVSDRSPDSPNLSPETEEATNKIRAKLEKERIAAEKQREKEAKEKLVPYIEAALFLAGRPISELELAEQLGTDRLTVRWALRRIKRTLQEQNSALEILNPTKDRWVLQLCEEFSRGLYAYIKEFIPKEALLSPEEIDALTEIAYRQPITSALLAKILGRPTIYENIKTLHEKGFIVTEPHERTQLLKTSKKFADIYGFDTEMRNLKIQLVWRLKKRAKFRDVP
ncbi:MAG: SMC-Scp complex subunit ScpB [Candidatus Helarchaeota archaeon]